MKKLLLLLLLSNACFGQLSLGTPADLHGCDDNYDNSAIFDLTVNTSAVLNGLNPNLYSVKFYQSMDAAEGDYLAIENPANFNSNPELTMSDYQTIFVRVTELATPAIHAETFFIAIVHQSPDSTLDDGSYCVDYNTDEVTFPCLLSPQLTGQNYSYVWFKDGVVIPNATQGAYNASAEGYYEVLVTNTTTNCSSQSGATVTKSSAASPIGEGYTVNGQNITVAVEGLGSYIYSLDGGPIGPDYIFNNTYLGLHHIYVYDENSCFPLVLDVMVTIPNPPVAEPSQNLGEGATLADIEIEGENIQWYDGIGPDSTMGTQETPLPLTTLLVNGTTYYATQTINGVESEERLAVTVHLTMGVNEQTFKGLQYYPNPVTSTLNISNTNVLDNVTVYNFLGQLVLSKNISAQTTEIDLSTLTTGIYTVKVNSAGQSKTIKIQKN